MNIPMPFKTLLMSTAIAFVSAVSLSSEACAAAKKVVEKEGDGAVDPDHHVVLLNKADTSKPLGVAISFKDEDLLSSVSEADEADETFREQLAYIKESHEVVAKEKGVSVVPPNSTAFYIGRSRDRATKRSAIQGLLSKNGQSFLALGYQPALYGTTEVAGVVSAEQAVLNIALHAFMAKLGVIEKIDGGRPFARANVREKAGTSCAALFPFFHTDVPLDTRVRYVTAIEALMRTPVTGEPSRPIAVTSFVGLYDDVTQKALQLCGWNLVLPALGNIAHAFYPKDNRVLAYKRLRAPTVIDGAGGGGSALAETLRSSGTATSGKEKV